MLLDKLLRNIDIHVEPFATCLLDTGWRMKLPAPPEAMFHFVLLGSGAIRGRDGESQTLDRFSLAIVPRGTPHALECGQVLSEEVIPDSPAGSGILRLVAGDTGSGDLRIACGLVRVSYGDSLGLFRHLNDVLVADLSAFPQARSAFEALLAEQGGATPGSDALTQALMSQCLVYLFRYLTEQSGDALPWLALIEDPSLSVAVDLIFDKPGGAHSVESLAATAMMSRSVFSDRFHAAFGTAPMSFVHDVRLRRAAEVLQRDPHASIAEVGKQVGFSSRSHFSQAFKERFGVAPAAFRSTEPPRALQGRR